MTSTDLTTQMTPQMTPQELVEYQAAIDEMRVQDGSKAFNLRLMKVSLDGAEADRFKANDGSKHAVVSGVVVVARKVRVFYTEKYKQGSHERPNCLAVGNMVQGSEAPNGEFGGTCAICPMNEWGTADKGAAKGKACSERRVLGILSNELGPVQLGIPSTSIGAWDLMASSLRGRGKNYFQVPMRIIVSQGKVTFSVDDEASPPTPIDIMEMAKSRAEWIALIEREAGVDEAAGYDAEDDGDGGGYYGT